MNDIENFFINKLKEKHIVLKIFKYYYLDWDESRINILKKDINRLESLKTRSCVNNKKRYNDIIDNKKRELLIIKYNNMKKYEILGKLYN